MTLNKDGSQQIHISTRKPLSNRGKKFSLPKPQGGKYAVNPILSADQPIPQQKKSSMAIVKTNALSEDYTAGIYVVKILKWYFFFIKKGYFLMSIL